MEPRVKQLENQLLDLETELADHTNTLTRTFSSVSEAMDALGELDQGDLSAWMEWRDRTSPSLSSFVADFKSLTTNLRSQYSIIHAIEKLNSGSNAFGRTGSVDALGDEMWALEEALAHNAPELEKAVVGLYEACTELDELADLDEWHAWVKKARVYKRSVDVNWDKVWSNVTNQVEIARRMDEDPVVTGSAHTAISSEPVQRAYERMDAAARRGGIEGLIKETFKRVQATRDPYKREGIATVLDDLIKDLQDLRKAVR